jgi:zona occludens toxin (predicted ATPase)
MKKLVLPLLAFPISWCLLGCNATDNGSSDAANSTSNAATADATVGASTVAAEATPASSATPTAAPTAVAKKTYQVINETPSRFPPAIVAALKKAKVPPPPAATKVPAKALVRLQTTKGDITLELNGKAAPLHVKAFCI